MQPRYPRQGDQADRYARQLQTQHDVDIKRLWGMASGLLNPYSGPSALDLPPNPTTTTSTTTAAPRCCDAYSCADVFIPDVLDLDGVTTIPGGWFRLTGSSCTMSNGPVEYFLDPYVTFGQFDVPGVGLRWILTYLPQGSVAGLPQLEWYFSDPLTCPGPSSSTDGAQKVYLGFPVLEEITETATITWVDCGDPTSTTTTTSTTTADPTTTTTTTTTTTSTTTPGDLPTTTTTSTTTGGETTTTSTTTSGEPCGGTVCRYEWLLTGGPSPYAEWVQIGGFCPSGCNCGVPPRDGRYLGEVYETVCNEDAPGFLCYSGTSVCVSYGMTSVTATGVSEGPWYYNDGTLIVTVTCTGTDVLHVDWTDGVTTVSTDVPGINTTDGLGTYVIAGAC